MKVNARKAVVSIKRASVATENSVVIPELNAGDDFVQSKISYKFVEDDILIGSSNQNEFENMEKPRAAIYLDCEYLDGQNSGETGDISGTITDCIQIPFF